MRERAFLADDTQLQQQLLLGPAECQIGNPRRYPNSADDASHMEMSQDPCRDFCDELSR